MKDNDVMPLNCTRAKKKYYSFMHIFDCILLFLWSMFHINNDLMEKTFYFPFLICIQTNLFFMPNISSLNLFVFQTFSSFLYIVSSLCLTQFKDKFKAKRKISKSKRNPLKCIWIWAEISIKYQKIYTFRE